MTAKNEAQDDALDEDAIEFGRWLFAQECDFLIGAAALAQVPPTGAPEVAFAGRSNVGKSSLINALTGRKTLARTSATPGRTRELNFFRLGSEDGPHLFIADLPGYGFARASKALAKKWQGLMRGYLQGRANLRRVILLVDARHGIKDTDRDMMTMLDDAAVSYQVVLTKADKLTGAEQDKVLERVRADIARHVAAHPVPVLTSAVRGIGIEDLRAHVAALATT